MGEFDRPFSHEPREQSSIAFNVELYGADCYFGRDHLPSMLIAFMRYVQGEFKLDESGMSDLSVRLRSIESLVPSEELFEREPRQAVELFGLAPLQLLGDHIETLYNLNDISEWYEAAIKTALMLYDKGLHKGCECVSLSPAAPGPCVYSQICPPNFLRYMLIKPIERDDFNDISYTINPSKHEEIIQMKLELAINLGLLMPSDAAGLVDIRESIRQRHRIIHPNAHPETE